MSSNGGLIDVCPGNVQGVSGYLFLTLINSLLGSKCKLGSTQPYNENYAPKLQDEDEFDFIVIGSGSAGSVVANKLSENPQWKILVLEAGGYPSSTSDIPSLLFSLQETEEDWQYKTEPSENSCLGFKDSQCRWPRGKVLGGCSTINAMVYIRGNKRDYDQWADLGNTGWDWENVKEQFEKMENIADCSTIIEIRDPIKYSMDEAFKLKGYNRIGEDKHKNHVGILDTNTCIDNGMRKNTAKIFLGMYKERPNLLTALNSFVQKIIIDPKEKIAVAVKVKIGEKILTLKASKEIILSAGSINSPQILMLSGIGPKEHLKEKGIELLKDLPVGEHLQDHLVHGGFDIALDSEAILPESKPENMLNNLYKYFAYQKGGLATIGLTSYLNFINTKNDSLYPNIQYHNVLYGQNDQYLIYELSRKLGFNDDTTSSRLDTLKNGNLLTVWSTLLNPKSQGKILLKSSNPDDHPIIQTGYMSDKNDEDIEIMLEAIRFLEDLFEMSPIQKFHPKLVKLNLPACDQYEFRSNEYWKCSLRQLSTTVYHPTSTCTMGPKDDGNSVVDPRLKVHGIKNLRVVDASIMPKVVSANTHATAMMIGHKGGEIILEDWSTEHDEL